MWPSGKKLPTESNSMWKGPEVEACLRKKRRARVIGAESKEMVRARILNRKVT